jgi:glycopeptide antibiotics resistance protein
MRLRWHVLIAATALLYLGAVVVLVFAPLPIVRYHTMFWELLGKHLGIGWTLGRERALDGVVNVGLFFPIGFLIHHWWRSGASASWATAGATLAALGLLASTIEFVQLFLPWRDASVADILTNTLGGAIGITVDTVLAWSASRPRQSPTDPR